MELSDKQVSWLKRAADIGRNDYSEAKTVQRLIYQILGGKDVSEELKEYDDE